MRRSARSRPANAKAFAAVAIVAFAGIGLGAVPAQAAPQDLTFTATADAYVDEGAPAVAHGAQAATDCFVNDDVGSRRECRLRFVVAGLQADDTVTSARVLARNKGGAGAKLVNMSTVAGSPAWAENAITWNNRPSTATLQGSDAAHIWGVDSEFAVRPGVVTANGTYDFALHSPPASYAQGLNFHAKENPVGQPAARLVVTINRPTAPVLAITSVTCVGFVADGYNVAYTVTNGDLARGPGDVTIAGRIVEPALSRPAGGTFSETALVGGTAASLAVSWLGYASPAVATPSCPQRPGPAFGINVRADGGGGERTSPAERLADFGRIPWARNPYYSLDARDELPTRFDLTTANAIAPEQRLQVSFKQLPARILDGSWDARITSYLNSIPAGWTVGVTYWHEPNGEIGSAFTAAEYKEAWYRIGGLIESSTSAATLIAMPNYTGPGGARFDDGWVVSRARMPANSILTWDKYGGVPPAIDAPPDPLKPYWGLYRRPADVFGPTMAATTRLGWGDSWGMSEFNAPRRTADADEADRRKWFVDAIAYLTSHPSGVGAPKHLFVWEGDGVQMDLNFKTQAMRNALRPYFEGSP